MGNSARLRLYYFPFPGRAGPIRDALRIGQIPFEDIHIPPEQFQKKRAAGEFPFGGLPVFDIETSAGTVRSAQSNAILRYAGRLSRLYTEDDYVQALKIDEALDLGEDINELLGPSLHEQDMDRKLAMRKVLAEETLPYWANCFERLLMTNGNTGYIAGKHLSIADLKLYWVIDFLTNESLDGIPKTLLDNFEAVMTWRKNITSVREARLAAAENK